MKVDADLNIQVPDVSWIWLELENALNLLSPGTGEVILEVEYCLFPMSVGSLGGRGEANSLVTMGELNVEERYQSLSIKRVSICSLLFTYLFT